MSLADLFIPQLVTIDIKGARFINSLGLQHPDDPKPKFKARTTLGGARRPSPEKIASRIRKFTARMETLQNRLADTKRRDKERYEDMLRQNQKAKSRIKHWQKIRDFDASKTG